MGIYGFGQARNARIFMRNNNPLMFRRPPMFMGGPNVDITNITYKSGIKPWQGVLFGFLMGVAEWTQQRAMYKQFSPYSQGNTQVPTQQEKNLATLQMHRPGWVISENNGKFIATKLDASGKEVVKEFEGTYDDVMSQTGSYKSTTSQNTQTTQTGQTTNTTNGTT